MGISGDPRDFRNDLLACKHAAAILDPRGSFNNLLVGY